MTKSRPYLHRVPRHPHAWIWLTLLSQILVAALWWQYGWRIGLLALLITHAVLLWGVFWPQSCLYSPVLTRLPIADQRIWLTIDDGPSDQTLAILDLLDTHQAKATFFVVGARAAMHPELIREIARRGHGLGNHSDTHPAAWFWALPPWRMAREIARAQAILQSITSQAPHWFRAVVGLANPFVAASLKQHGLARVAWSARGFDGVVADPQRVVARIERRLAPGAIVLLHEGARHGGNIETIRWMLTRLHALGYSTVLPETLPNFSPQATR